MHPVSTQHQPTASILDEYCRYYSDFSKILGIYIKNIYPQLHFELEQLLDASYNVWHRLSDEEKISLATFLEEISQENNHIVLSSSKMQTVNDLLNSELLSKKLKSIPLNTNSYVASNKKRLSITPFNIYLKDERKKFLKKHSKMSMREINKRLSSRWQKMSNRMKQKYEHRSHLAKKRLYKNPSFIQQSKKINK